PDVAVIQDFERRLEKRFLRKEGAVWYADFTASPYPEELSVAGSYIEGATKSITINAYERDPAARRACIAYHGAVCQCCGFDFEKTWGEHGKGFIHVHHIRPLRTLGPDYQGSPQKTESIPRLMNLQKIYGFNEPFRFTGSSTGRWAVSIINISIRKTRSVIL
ncbi:MAG: hypothetical protein E6928_26370, partial [Citrobacter freundii]|nr:hypothetical protein [Citrobacter freundii]